MDIMGAGRPQIGTRYEVRLPDDIAAAVDEYAAAHGIAKRAEALRLLVATGLKFADGPARRRAMTVELAGDNLADAIADINTSGLNLVSALSVHQDADNHWMYQVVAYEVDGGISGHRFLLEVREPGSYVVSAATTRKAAIKAAHAEIKRITAAYWSPPAAGEQAWPLWDEIDIPSGLIDCRSWDMNELQSADDAAIWSATYDGVARDADDHLTPPVTP
jgi:hypothetical protein